MKHIHYILLLLIICSCNSKKQNTIVKGHVKHLKKGTLYLERQLDSSSVILDSVIVNGDANFELKTNLTQPEVLTLRLDKNDNQLHSLLFFAEAGETVIKTTLKQFLFDAEIIGGEQQGLLKEYQDITAKFRNKNLDLIKTNFEALKENDTAKLNAIKIESESLLKRRYLYATNFAVTNSKHPVSAYIAVTDLKSLNPKLLDTIVNALSPKVKESLYGKQLLQLAKN